jgi:hypothetical protein
MPTLERVHTRLLQSKVGFSLLPQTICNSDVSGRAG